MSEYEPNRAQLETISVLVQLIGLSGVHKRPPQGEDLILDLLPGSHMALGFGGMGEPFCVRVAADGSVREITDAEAGLDQRPDPLGTLRP